MSRNSNHQSNVTRDCAIWTVATARIVLRRVPPVSTWRLDALKATYHADPL
jgi:hypothetical protein